MKEATGELNMTVITVVAIAAVGALFTFLIWPSIKQNIALSTACANIDAKGNYKGPTGADGSSIECNTYSCTYIDSQGVAGGTKDCK